MIIREQLTGTFHVGDAKAIYNEIKAEGNFYAFVQQYLYDEDIRVVRKVLWGVCQASKEELAELLPMQNELIDYAIKTPDSSAQRMVLSIIERLNISEKDLRTDFLDFCLENMTRPENCSANQALCMKLACKMCSFYPELKDELLRTLETMDMEYYSPAVKSVRNKILKENSIPQIRNLMTKSKKAFAVDNSLYWCQLYSGKLLRCIHFPLTPRCDLR